MTRVKDIKKFGRMRCIIGLVGCLLVLIVVQIAYSINLSNAIGRTFENVGLKTLRMFTTLSNLLVTSAAVLCIPYQIEGLRKNNYHLPNWIVIILYMGTTGVSITFITALTAISIVQGFRSAMISETNIFLHTISPILSIILFTFVNDDHHVEFKRCFISLIPMLTYALVYLIQVFIRGTWTDHYQFDKFIPWPITFVLMLGISFGISNLIRYLHNVTHKRRKQKYADYYQNSLDIKSDTIEEAIVKLAKINKKDYLGGDIEIPRRSIKMMKPAYEFNLTDEELYKIYIDAFLTNDK